LQLSRGESKDKQSKARQNIHANAIEAIIGAMYLDGGIEPATTFITTHILSKLPHILANELYIDPKSKFQEMSQEVVGITPSYKVLKEWGPDHDKHFLVAVCLGTEEVATGEGASKQEAQVAAADNGLIAKGWQK
jgi:ribonuclease-3